MLSLPVQLSIVQMPRAWSELLGSLEKLLRPLVLSEY